MLLIYRKIDGIVLNNQGINTDYPLGVENIEAILINTIERYGGTTDNYAAFRLHDTEDVEIVNKTFTHQYSIQNGEIVFGDENPPQPEPVPDPTETEMMMDYLVDVDYRVTMIELGL